MKFAVRAMRIGNLTSVMKKVIFILSTIFTWMMTMMFV